MNWLLIRLLRKRVIKRSQHSQHVMRYMRCWQRSCDYRHPVAEALGIPRHARFSALSASRVRLGQSCCWHYGALLRDFAFQAAEIETVSRRKQATEHGQLSDYWSRINAANEEEHQFLVTEWRDGCVMRTASQGHGWFG
jgi:hypothetical protein